HAGRGKRDEFLKTISSLSFSRPPSLSPSCLFLESGLLTATISSGTFAGRILLGPSQLFHSSFSGSPRRNAPDGTLLRVLKSSPSATRPPTGSRARQTAAPLPHRRLLRKPPPARHTVGQRDVHTCGHSDPALRTIKGNAIWPLGGAAF